MKNTPDYEDLKDYEDVFVYGTLKKGHRNNYLVTQLGCSLKDTDCTTFSNTFGMFTQENPKQYAYPIAYNFTKEKPRMVRLGKIQGEVYTVPKKVLAELDILERNGELYQREEVLLSTGDFAWMYLIKHTPLEYTGLIEMQKDPNNPQLFIWR